MADKQTYRLPEGVHLGSEKLLQLSFLSGQKILQLSSKEKENNFLRIAITGGGCNGLSYKLKFEQKPKQGDILVRSSGVNVIVDVKSALYLKGTTLDYSSQLVSGGFKFSNPNARSKCSCGESFSI